VHGQSQSGVAGAGSLGKARTVDARGARPVRHRDISPLLADDADAVGSRSEIAQREGLHHSTVNELLGLTLLEPAIIRSILAGMQARCMSLIWFQRNRLPLDWIAQRRVVDGFDF